MKKTLICAALVLLAVSAAFSQKRGKKITTAKPKTIVFAVLDDGKTLEPVGLLDKGELVGAESEGDDKSLMRFVNTYYKPGTNYNLIFGGKTGGLVTVKSSNPKSECGKNLGTVTTKPTGAPLKGLVMGLATNDQLQSNAKGMRRMPTSAERAEIETLVRAEFTKQGISSGALSKMKYQNLTALDVDHDGKAEMVGSYWAENTANERDMLFFIAEQNKAGKYSFGYSEYNKVTPDQMMGGAELKDLDEGRGHELLLDVMPYDGDDVAEIFTINQAFEGNNFHVYSRREGKWKRVFEGYNYHCAF